MRLDKQHKEYHINMMGLPVYFASSKEGATYWKDMLHAFALTMRGYDPELMSKRVGAGTGAILLTRLALKWLPEPYASETQAHYLRLLRIRQATEAINAETPAT